MGRDFEKKLASKEIILRKVMAFSWSNLNNPKNQVIK